MKQTNKELLVLIENKVKELKKEVKDYKEISKEEIRIRRIQPESIDFDLIIYEELI
jgi:hypothetical protein